MLFNSVQREGPGLFVFDTCAQFIRTVPGVPRDQTDMDDVDTDTEDHVADESRYRAVTNPVGQLALLFLSDFFEAGRLPETKMGACFSNGRSRANQIWSRPFHFCFVAWNTCLLIISYLVQPSSRH
jgi:hypothetical protein